MWWIALGCVLVDNDKHVPGDTPPESGGTDTDEPDTSGTDSATENATDSATPADDTAEAVVAVTLLAAASCTNPCTFSATVSGNVAALRYEADEWALGETTPDAPELTYTFSEVGDRLIRVVALDEAGEALDADEKTVRVEEPAAIDRLGVWLWYIEGTGMDHDALAARLASLGVGRIYVKVADGDASCSSWPELCDRSVPAAYQAAGLEAWAWAYVYPGSAAAQAEALTQAARTGYDGYVLDIETEFDYAATSLEQSVSAFADARDDAIADGTIATGWELRATTWGNPADHGMRVDIIDRYVDAHMPQTYLEAWGSTYMADASGWVQAGTCEYRDLGATGPIHHIVSTEYGDITPAQIDTFIAASGSGTSIWRVPGEGTPMSIWDDWEAVNWGARSFDDPDCP